MLGLWDNKGGQEAAVSPDFTHALMQQVLRTELIRIKALIGTAALIAVMLWTIHTIDPKAVDHLWHGRLKPNDLFAILIPFILFELWVHTVITRHLRRDPHLAVATRYASRRIYASI